MRLEIVLTNIIMLFEFLSFFYVVFRRKFRERTPQMLFCIAAWVLFWGVAMMAGFDWQSSIVIPVPAFFLIYILLIWILFDLSIKEIVPLGLANWLILSIIEENVIITIQTLYKIEERRFDGIIMFVISCVIWGFYFAKKNNYNAKAFNLPIRIWVLMDVIMIILMAMLSFFTYVIVTMIPDGEMSSTGQVLLLFGGILIIVLLLVFVYYYSSTYEYRIQKEIMEMQIRQQREYFERLLEREEDTRKFRHDILNDLLELQNYCEKNKCQQMRQYLGNLTGVVTQISKKSYDVGNSTVNTILNYYLTPINDRYVVEINGMLPDKISVDDRDICIICANIIRNAAEAVSRTDNGKIWVNIESGKSYLHFQVENTFEGEIDIDKNGIPTTSKDDKHNHGIGIRNVCEIVHKNGGICDFKAENGQFKSDIFIKL